MLKKVAVLALGSTLLACSNMGVTTEKMYQLYTGPELPIEQVASVVVPVELNVIAVDGESVEGVIPSIMGGAKRLALKPGYHQIVVKYDQLFDVTSDEHEVIQSKNYSLSADLQANHTYTVAFNAPKTLREAKEFAKDPQFKLTDGTQAVAEGVKFKSFTAIDGGLLSNLKLGDSSNNPVNNTDAVPSTDASESVQLMQFWWKKASVQEKQMFMEWLKQQ